jgi:hypothetical protein
VSWSACPGISPHHRDLSYDYSLDRSDVVADVEGLVESTSNAVARCPPAETGFTFMLMTREDPHTDRPRHVVHAVAAAVKTDVNLLDLELNCGCRASR